MIINDKIISYKGFNGDMTCHGFQFEVGKEYEQEGRIIACENGFHACIEPLDVFEFYLIDKDGNIARFCEVEQSGEFDEEETKTVSSKIFIRKEIPFNDFVDLAIESFKHKCKLVPDNLVPENLLSFVGHGNYLITKDQECFSPSGYYNIIITSAFSTKLSLLGDYNQVFSVGNSSQIVSAGYHSQIISTGKYAVIATTGNNSIIISSGYSAKLSTSGRNNIIVSTGSCAEIVSTGKLSLVSSSGKDARIVATGKESQVKAKRGSWITLAEYDDMPNANIPIRVKTEQVDGERIKEDSWYRLIDGKFAEIIRD